MKIIAPLLLFFSMFLLCVALAMVPSCASVDCKNPANASSIKCVAEQAVVDCTTSAALGYVAQHESDIAKYFTPASIDWTSVESTLKTLASSDAICVLDKVVESYLTANPESSIDAGVVTDGGVAIGGTVTIPAVRQKAIEIKARVYPGKTAKH